MIGSIAATLLLAGSPHGAVGIRWEKNFDEALKKARAASKPVIVDFWADWCGWCHRLDRTTYVDPKVVQLSKGFVAVKVNAEGTPSETSVAVRYDVNSLPTIAFLSPAGRPLMRLNGYQGPGQFPRTLENAQEVARRVIAWENAIARNPDDAEALAGLGVHLFEQDAYTESAQLLARAMKLDAKRALEERKQTRLLLGYVLKSDEQFTQAEKVLKAGIALPPSSENDPKLLYLLGKLYFAWGRPDEARAALTQVVNNHGHSSIARKARETLVAMDQK